MLNKKEVNFYYKNGYVILENKLDNKTLSELKKSTKLLIEEYKKNKSYSIKFYMDMIIFTVIKFIFIFI